MSEDSIKNTWLQSLLSFSSWTSFFSLINSLHVTLFFSLSKSVESLIRRQRNPQLDLTSPEDLIVSVPFSWESQFLGERAKQNLWCFSKQLLFLGQSGSAWEVHCLFAYLGVAWAFVSSAVVFAFLSRAFFCVAKTANIAKKNRFVSNLFLGNQHQPIHSVSSLKSHRKRWRGRRLYSRIVRYGRSGIALYCSQPLKNRKSSNYQQCFLCLRWLCKLYI